MVDEGLDLKVALGAGMPPVVSGEVDVEEAVAFAKEMAGLNLAVIKKIVEAKNDNPR